jgi:hypothetical protein
MEKGTHGRNEETFEELSYSNQAKSINGQLRVIEKAIRAHMRKAESVGKNGNETRNICIGQLERVIENLNRE